MKLKSGGEPGLRDRFDHATSPVRSFSRKRLRARDHSVTHSLCRSLLSWYRACAVVTATLMLGTNVQLAAGEVDSANRIAALRDSFPYTPSAPIETTLVPSDEPLIVLDVLTITESMSRRALATQIEDRWAREKWEAFTRL